MQRGCGEQNFRKRGNGIFDGVRNAVGRLVNIPQPVRFINDNEIPFYLLNINVLAAGKVIRANDNFVPVKRIRFPFLICSLNVRASKMTDGRKNLSDIS